MSKWVNELCKHFYEVQLFIGCEWSSPDLSVKGNTKIEIHFFTIISEKLQKLFCFLLYHLPNQIIVRIENTERRKKGRDKNVSKSYPFFQLWWSNTFFVRCDWSSIFQLFFSNDNWQVRGGETRRETTRQEL